MNFNNPRVPSWLSSFPKLEAILLNVFFENPSFVTLDDAYRGLPKLGEIHIGCDPGNIEDLIADLERIGQDLENISIELGNVSTRFGQAINSFSIHGLVLIIKYLLIYLGILNTMFILNGIMFLILKR